MSNILYVRLPRLASGEWHCQAVTQRLVLLAACPAVRIHNRGSESKHCWTSRQWHPTRACRAASRENCGLFFTLSQPDGENRRPFHAPPVCPGADTPALFACDTCTTVRDTLPTVCGERKSARPRCKRSRPTRSGLLRAGSSYLVPIRAQNHQRRYSPAPPPGRRAFRPLPGPSSVGRTYSILCPRGPDGP
jgi:hypothetical protein